MSVETVDPSLPFPALRPWGRVKAGASSVPPDPRSTGARVLLARILSGLALIGAIIGMGYAGISGVRLFTDSMVAPIILSPDNDIVIQHKVTLTRLQAERQTMLNRLEEGEQVIDTVAKSLGRLQELRDLVLHSLEWSTALTNRQLAVWQRQLDSLGAEKNLFAQMTKLQERVVQETEKDFESGLVHRSDLEREQSALEQLRVSGLRNTRESVETQGQLQTTSLAGQVLRLARMRSAAPVDTDPSSTNPTATPKGAAIQARRPGVPPTPDLVAQQDQLARIEIETLKLEAERRSRISQRRADSEILAQIDELIQEMKARPVFRAIERSQYVAFVPYSQLRAVVAGADVIECQLWGIFDCGRVGRVLDLVAGEVATQDPWGTLARGQYALLALDRPTAAQAKSLRIRDGAQDPVAWVSRVFRRSPARSLAQR